MEQMENAVAVSNEAKGGVSAYVAGGIAAAGIALGGAVGWFTGRSSGFKKGEAEAKAALEPQLKKLEEEIARYAALTGQTVAQPAQPAKKQAQP